MPEILTTHDMPDERAEQVAARIFERKEMTRMTQMTDEEHKQLQIDELVELHKIRRSIENLMALTTANIIAIAGLTLLILRG